MKKVGSSIRLRKVRFYEQGEIVNKNEQYKKRFSLLNESLNISDSGMVIPEKKRAKTSLNFKKESNSKMISRIDLPTLSYDDAFLQTTEFHHGDLPLFIKFDEEGDGICFLNIPYKEKNKIEKKEKEIQKIVEKEENCECKYKLKLK